MSMLNDLLAPDYKFLEVLVDPQDCGHAGVNRPRKYIFCYHCSTARYLYDVQEAYRLVKSAIQSVVQTRPRDHMVADPHQILAHAAHVAAVRKIPFRADTFQAC